MSGAACVYNGQSQHCAMISTMPDKMLCKLPIMDKAYFILRYFLLTSHAEGDQSSLPCSLHVSGSCSDCKLDKNLPNRQEDVSQTMHCA